MKMFTDKIEGCLISCASGLSDKQKRKQESGLPWLEPRSNVKEDDSITVVIAL